MPRIEREIASVNVGDAFDSSSNRSFPIIVGRPFKKRGGGGGKKEKKSQTRTLATRPSQPFLPSPRYSLANCIEPPLDPSGDASSRRCRRGPRTCNPSEQCKQSMHRSRFIRTRTVPFWFLNYCSPDDRSRPTIALLRPNMLQPFSAGGASLPLITFLVPPPLLPQQQAKIRPWIRKGEERTIAERRADNNDLEKFCTGIRCNIRGGRVELLFPRAEERRW